MTGLKNIKYRSSDFWIFKKNIKILRINDFIITLDFGFLWNLIINQKIGNEVRGDVVLIKINKTENLVKFREIEATENGIKLRGEL